MTLMEDLGTSRMLERPGVLLSALTLGAGTISLLLDERLPHVLKAQEEQKRNTIIAFQP